MGGRLLEGRPWEAQRRMGKPSFEDGSSRSWIAWAINRGGECVRFMWQGDRTRRSQERSANGGAACAWRLRPAASFCCGWRLGRGAIGDRAAHSSGSARWWERRRVWNRRNGGAEEGHALGRRRCAIRYLVSLTLARGEVPVMVALRLFLPDSWVNDRRRLKRAGVPAEYRTSRTKPEIALAEIDRLISIGVRFRCVLADAGYGLSAPFRQGLTARKLAWAVGIPRHLKVYPVGVQLIWPVTKLVTGQMSCT